MATTEKTKKKAISSTTAKKVPKEQSTFARVTSLVVGDAIVFLIFAAIGRNNHGEASGFAAIPQIVLTALPFAVGWFIVAPFVGPLLGVLVGTYLSDLREWLNPLYFFTYTSIGILRYFAWIPTLALMPAATKLTFC